MILFHAILQLPCKRLYSLCLLDVCCKTSLNSSLYLGTLCIGVINSEGNFLPTSGLVSCLLIKFLNSVSFSCLI